MRLTGRSYNEIAKALPIPKSTLRSWLARVALPAAARERLSERMKSGSIVLMERNKAQTQVAKQRARHIRAIGAKRMTKVHGDGLLLAGALLYWAEGYNRQEKIPSPSISFGNSNPDMVVLFLRFLREVMQIPEERLRPVVQIHHNIKPKSAISFWAKITNIPKERFRVTHQTSRASKGKRPYNSLPYGTLKLDANGRQNFFKIKGWIDGLAKQNSR